MLEDLDSLNIGSLGGGRGGPMFKLSLILAYQL